MSIPTRRGGWRLWLVLTLVGATASACGALRQNLRNQFVSYRGTWHCPNEACRLPQMVRSTKNHREGTVNIAHARLNPKAALAFYPGTPVETFTATVSCGGKSAPVSAERLLPPGSHKLPGEPDVWVVVLDPGDYELGSCSTYRVSTHATWEGGKREYEEAAGIAVK